MTTTRFRGPAGSTPATRTLRRRPWAAVSAQSLMLGYFVVINWVDLAPWNNLAQAGDQTRGTVFGVVPGIGVLAALVFSGRRLRTAAATWSWIWFALQVIQWWVPYALDLHPLTSDGGRWYVDGGYDQTLHLLPVSPGRVVPDAEHNVQQLLSLTAAVLVTRAARRRP